jgi:hypothetical protein
MIPSGRRIATGWPARFAAVRILAVAAGQALPARRMQPMSTLRCPDCGAVFADDEFPDDPACPICGWCFSQQREWYLSQERGDTPAARPALLLDLWAKYPTNPEIFEHSRFQPEGPIIRNRARERFGHDVFADHMQRLTDWLRDEYGPDVHVFGLSLREVAERLKPQAPSPAESVAREAPPPAGEAADTNTIISLGNRSYQIGTQRPVVVGTDEDYVLQAFLRHPAMDEQQLRETSGLPDAAKVLKGLFSWLDGIFAHAIHLPGGKSRGGYHVRIRTQ